MSISANTILSAAGAELHGAEIIRREENVYKIIPDGKERPRLIFEASRAVGVREEGAAVYILSATEITPVIHCNSRLWVLPVRYGTGISSVQLMGEDEMTASCAENKTTVTLPLSECSIAMFPDRPPCDIYGNRIELSFPGGEILKKTLANFYWDTILPSVIEKTDAAGYPVSGGFVVSTLAPDKYAGTYPDVDHEFQCKGRLAINSPADTAAVEHMLALQCRLMREDPSSLWRNPCAVQPDGDREYHVRRNSMDGRTNAEMFLVTGNVEILETAWLYYAATKDGAWLSANIEDLEGAASLLEQLTDANGKLWSDVFYEDQVIKDGMECMSAALAAYSLKLLAELEQLLGRADAAKKYAELSNLLAETIVKPVPAGFWREDKNRFADWIDRNGRVHDHIHLLANCLPVLFGYANEKQRSGAEKTIERHLNDLQRFPTFLSPCIEDYTNDEIGTGGPYDLCAAGRYWCWDAAYWADKKQGNLLLEQLLKVAAQAELDGYRMGERYDMNHIYYKSDINWHGCPYYYEYPNVFAWVLIHEYLGVRPSIDEDYFIRPLLQEYGEVRLEAHGTAYLYEPDLFVLENCGKKSRRYRIELDTLYPDMCFIANEERISSEKIYELSPGEKLIIKTVKG